MITMPTGELVGLLGDVIGFADTGPDADGSILESVRLWWDGHMLHTEASDRFLYGHAFWDPDDRPPTQKPELEGLFPKWGGDDDPWSILLRLDDAKDLVKNFNLGAKKWGIPLRVEYAGTVLRVFRDGKDGHSVLRQHIDARSWDTDYPDMVVTLARSREFLGDGGLPVATIAFEPRRLAVWEKVRQRGPVEFRFWGDHKAADVTIGDRFVGAVMPFRAAEEPTPAPEAAPALAADMDMDPLDLDDLVTVP